MPAHVSSQRKFWISAAAGALLVAGLGGAFAFGIGYVETSWRVITAARGALAAQDTKRSDVLQADRILQDLASERASLEGAFADPANPLPVIEAIEGLASRMGLQPEISLASASGAKNPDSYNVRVMGPFRSVLGFLGNLESLPFLATIQDTHIRSTAGASRESRVIAGPPGGPGSMVELTVSIYLVAP